MENQHSPCLMDPTADFCEAVRKDTLVRGQGIADELFTGDMASAMGEVFGDILANGVIGSIGGSLFDVPMIPPPEICGLNE